MRSPKILVGMLATVAVMGAACGDSDGTTLQVDEAPTVAVVRAFMDSALVGDAEALDQTVTPMSSTPGSGGMSR